MCRYKLLFKQHNISFEKSQQDNYFEAFYNYGILVGTLKNVLICFVL